MLVTGGAGFVGSNLCVHLAAVHPDWEIVAFDSLMRRGSELTLDRLRGAGVTFVHGDVRVSADLASIGPVDAVVECSAEPSALAGVDGSPEYLVQTNLVGAYHCLEVARRYGAQLVFLSTSRVYPYRALDALPYRETETRFELEEGDGVDERFPLEGPRTLYGATKLSAELLVGEYAEVWGLPAVINRCGVIAGPWQMGKVDQGVFTWWVLAHVLGRPLNYIGYGGAGKQVRDLLHVGDLAELIERQLDDPEAWSGKTVNVGGGREVSLSLVEATELCAELTGSRVPVGVAGEDRPGDVRIYLSDCSRLFALTDWRPRRDARAILEDVVEWVRGNEDLVRSGLG